MPRSLLSALAGRLVLVAAAFAPLAAQAPEGFAGDLKFHLAYTPSPKDHLRSAAQTVGIHLGWGTPWGRVGAELGWYYQTGDGFVEPLGVAPADKAPVTASRSGDARRNDLNGLMVRLTLQRPTGVEDLRWHAGLQLGGTRWNQQYFGDISGGYVATTTPNTWAWRDTYSGNLRQSHLGISPMVGLSWKVIPKGSLELNALLVNYQSATYVHAPGTAPVYKGALDFQGKPTSPISDHNAFPLDSVRRATRWQPQLELAYVFHF